MFQNQVQMYKLVHTELNYMFLKILNKNGQQLILFLFRLFYKCTF